MEMADDSLAPIGETLLFENEHVRVWENVIEPGKESPVHRHDHDYLSIDIEGRPSHPQPGEGWALSTDRARRKSAGIGDAPSWWRDRNRD